MALPPTPRLKDRRSLGAQCRFVDIELIRVHSALNDTFTETLGRGGEHRIGEARFGIHGEHHSGRAYVGSHHSLHPGGDANCVMSEAVMHPIADRTIVIQRCEDFLDRLQNGLDAANIEKCFLLTGQNEASGRSSAVAHDRTAKDIS
jgi:hypothetical protein